MITRHKTFASLIALCATGVFAAGPAHASVAPKQKPKQSQTRQAPKSQAQPSKDFPALSVTDVASGKPFDLATLGTLNKPVLVWFWAPT